MRNAVREHREARALTQGDLASKVGVTRQSINAIERGRYDPSLELALKLAAEFDTPVEELFWLDS
jgi:putative transcriptional regulator